MVDNRRHIGYTNSCPVHEGGYGGIAQLARALGSYPSCPRFKSRCRYHAASAAPHGALVKRLRHRPFTAVTRVRFPYASPTSPIWRHSSAGRALASHARGHRFEFCCLHQKERHLLFADVFLFGFRSRWSLCPSVIKSSGWQSHPSAEVLLRKTLVRRARAAAPKGRMGDFP